MAASASGPPFAGLHGRILYDFTRGDDHSEARIRCRDSVMDDGRAYSAALPSTPLVATANSNRRPNTKQRSKFAARSNDPVETMTTSISHKRFNPNNNQRIIPVIDLVDDSDSDDADAVIDIFDESDSDDADADDGTGRKRTLNRNASRRAGSSPNFSPLRQKRTRRPLRGNSQHPTFPNHLTMPSRNTGDGATVTFGLLSLIDLLKGVDTLTCGGSLASSRGKLFAPIKIPSSVPPLTLPFNHQPFHYLQNDSWSCGFRNMQMLISGMMPTLGSVFPRGVPSMEDIQRTMEELWSLGFDRSNAKHHNSRLVGKKTWIGTVEVWAYLTFKRVDAIVVQFIKTNENRAMLGKFVWAYFNRECGEFGCSCINSRGSRAYPLASPILDSSEYAAHLLREVSTPSCSVNPRGVGSVPRCECSLPPLYLQWEGHSVTVVGIRKINRAAEQPPSFNLLIFCPQKKRLCFYLKGLLTSELSRRQSANNKRQSSKESRCFEDSMSSVIELPTSKLKNRDCQILLSTAHIIDEAESKRRKKCTRNIGYLDAMAAAKSMG